MATVLKVAAGVFLGGALLIGLGALVGVIDLGGSDGQKVPTKGGSEKDADKAADQAIDQSVGGYAPEEDRGAKYCESEKGDRLTQLSSAYNDVLGDRNEAEKVMKLQQSTVALGKEAPPGAYCVPEAIDTFIHYWNASVADKAKRRYKPREQVRELRKFVREGRFEERTK